MSSLLEITVEATLKVRANGHVGSGIIHVGLFDGRHEVIAKTFHILGLVRTRT
jgi:hypothetical protein